MLQDGGSRHNRNPNRFTFHAQATRPNKPDTAVPGISISKKSVAGVATLKPPKEDGGYFCVKSASDRVLAAGY